MANKPDIEVENEGLKKLFDQQVETVSCVFSALECVSTCHFI